MKSSKLGRVLVSIAALTSAATLVGCSAGGGRSRESDSTTAPTGPGAYADPYNPGAPPATTGSNPAVTTTPPANSPSTETPVVNAPLDPATSIGRLGSAAMGGTGQSSERYHKTDVTRDGQNYYLMANGWGPGFGSQSLSWSGTSFTVQSMTGTQGKEYQPASYPTVFCGVYSDAQSKPCGLPAALDSLSSLETGWRWSPNGNMGQYNAAYDIWLGTGTTRASFSGFLMVWYREPVGQQPAGALALRNVSVDNVEGTWDVWTGMVNGKPIINFVRAENQDTTAMEFDVLDFVRSAEDQGLTVPGTHVLSVAVGFEIWNGPVTNLQSLDFYVDPQP